jgi:tetratricopeptide (TPR) repeat protein
LLLRQGQLREAEAELEAGLAKAPDDHHLLDTLARAAAARGRWSEAIDYGEQAIARTVDPATLGLLHQVYTASGDSAKAEEYYRAMSISVLGEPDTFHRLWGLMLLDRGREVPTVLVRAAREIEVRRDVYGWDLLAWALYRSGRPSEARAKMQHALALGTRDASIFYHAGMIEAALGRHGHARRYLETALAINPHWHPSQPAEAKQVLGRLAGREH